MNLFQNERSQPEVFLLEMVGLNLVIEERFLIKNLTLRVGVGQRVGLTGPSGCGKTTLLRSVLSARWPQGTTWKKVVEYSEKIGYSPQGNHLPPWFTVRRFLREMAQGNGSSQGVDEWVDEVLDMFELTHLASSFPDMLSGGEYQRALVAVSVVTQPKLYLADEPLTEVGLSQRFKLLERWSQAMRDQESSLLLVSHEIDVLLFLCDEVIVLHSKPAEVAGRIAIEAGHTRSHCELTGEYLTAKRNEILERLHGTQ